MTIEPVALTEEEARRLTERIRTALDRVSSAWSDLAERVAEAYERRADLALGYDSWAAYAEAELQPSAQLSVDVRRQLVGLLSAQGMSVRAIAPAVGAPKSTVHDDLQVSGNRTPEPERIDRETGEVESLDAYRARVLADAEANGKIVKLTGSNSVATPYDTQAPTTELEAPSALTPAEGLQRDRLGAPTPPAPRSVVGLDGKTYTRPEPKETTKETPMTAASRLAIPQPPRFGGNRPKHAQIIANAITTASGLCAALDEIKRLDGSINNEEAASYADDLSHVLRSLKRIQSLIKKEV